MQCYLACGRDYPHPTAEMLEAYSGGPGVTHAILYHLTRKTLRHTTSLKPDQTPSNSASYPAPNCLTLILINIQCIVSVSCYLHCVCVALAFKLYIIAFLSLYEFIESFQIRRRVAERLLSIIYVLYWIRTFTSC